MTLDHAEYPFTASPRLNERLRGYDVAQRGVTAERARRVVGQPGRPLDSATRAEMESSFGYDFGGVRVHADRAAAASADGLDAIAYSLNRHVVFAQGQYAPDTGIGRQLLAHELAHVVQQDARAPGREWSAAAQTHDVNALETDASRAADVAATGGPAVVRQRAAGGRLLRQARPAGAGPAAAPAAPSKPQREERFNLGRGFHHVDAELDRSIGWLTVKMKVKFKQTNIPRPWPSPARFAQFQTDYIRTVTQRWSFKHFLVPDRACPGEPSLVAVRLQIIPVTSGEQYTLNVGYATDYYQSSVEHDRPVGTLDVLDTSQRSDQPQTPAEHEFGHMLGLPHINCASNAPECYGEGGTAEQRADVMGEGSYVSPRDYEPFAELMPYFAGCNYRVRQASYVPTSRAPDIGGAIGFLAGGIGLGLAGAAIGGLFGPIGAIVGGLVGMVGGAIGGYFAGRALATPHVPS